MATYEETREALKVEILKSLSGATSVVHESPNVLRIVKDGAFVDVVFKENLYPESRLGKIRFPAVYSGPRSIKEQSVKADEEGNISAKKLAKVVALFTERLAYAQQGFR